MDYGGDNSLRGTQFIVAIGITLAPGYSTYAPGYVSGDDTPKPVQITLHGAGGSPISASVFYPRATEKADPFDPSRKLPVYTDHFYIFVRFTTVPRPCTSTLSMLVCSSRNCIPVKATLPLTFPTPLPDLYSVAWKDDYLACTASTSSLQEHTQHTEYSLPSLQQPLPNASDWNFSPRSAQTSVQPAALASAVGFGFLAGLILNIMPCVLPVLTIKLSALLAASRYTDNKARLIHFREHNLCFAAGILSCFLLLAVAVGVFGLAWGGLFQHTYVVFGLLVLVFLLALSLFDVFTLPVLDLKIRVSETPRMQAWCSGFVATLLATPCSGPLLGGVLGWAVLQPLFNISIVFVATGLGMASPYLILAAWPGAARHLPRPGAWTEVIERLVGFFLMGTSLYLLSILPEALHFRVLVVLLITALTAWIWGHWGVSNTARRISSAVLGLFMLAVTLGWAFTPQAQPLPWVQFNTTVFRSLWQRTPLLVHFTADWCPSCKVMEQTVLTPSRLQPFIKQYGIRLVKVDLTRKNHEAESLLRALGNVSIPVTAIFPAGTLASSPLVLRDLYTAAQLEHALTTAIPRKN